MRAKSVNFMQKRLDGLQSSRLPELDQAIANAKQEKMTPKLPWHQRRALTQKFLIQQCGPAQRKDGESLGDYRMRQKSRKKLEKAILRGTPVEGLD